MPAPDVYKMLKDLELKTVGLDPKTSQRQEGYFFLAFTALAATLICYRRLPK